MVVTFCYHNHTIINNVGCVCRRAVRKSRYLLHEKWATAMRGDTLVFDTQLYRHSIHSKFTCHIEYIQGILANGQKVISRLVFFMKILFTRGACTLFVVESTTEQSRILEERALIDVSRVPAWNKCKEQDCTNSL